MKTTLALQARRLAGDALIERTSHLLANERNTTAALLAHLAEIDARRLYLAEGYSSMFVWCTQVLHLSEHAAYNRIECARASRKFPVVLPMLARGDLHLTGIRLLAPHLSRANYRAVLAEARHLGRVEIAEIVARLSPRPDVPSSVRRVGDGVFLPGLQVPAGGAPVDDLFGGAFPSDTGSAEPGEAILPAGLAPGSAPDSTLGAGPGSAPVSAPGPTRRPVVAPLAPGRYRVQFTASQEAHDHLREAQALLRHQIPDGDPALVIEKALALLVNVLRKRKSAATGRPRRDRQHAVEHDGQDHLQRNGGGPTSRVIPADVRRAVWERDGGRCAFRGRSGRRCSSQDAIEFHHAEPFSLGGESTVDNVSLRCRAHNAHEAERDFGVTRRRSNRRAAAAQQGEPSPPGTDGTGPVGGSSSDSTARERPTDYCVTVSGRIALARTFHGTGSAGPGHPHPPAQIRPLFALSSPVARRERPRCRTSRAGP